MNDYQLQLECDLAMKRVMAKLDDFIQLYDENISYKNTIVGVIKFSKINRIYPYTYKSFSDYYAPMYGNSVK